MDSEVELLKTSLCMNTCYIKANYFVIIFLRENGYAKIRRNSSSSCMLEKVAFYPTLEQPNKIQYN
jgi:hypothetical protein